MLLLAGRSTWGPDSYTMSILYWRDIAWNQSKGMISQFNSIGCLHSTGVPVELARYSCSWVKSTLSHGARGKISYLVPSNIYFRGALLIFLLKREYNIIDLV